MISPWSCDGRKPQHSQGSRKNQRTDGGRPSAPSFCPYIPVFFQLFPYIPTPEGCISKGARAAGCGADDGALPGLCDSQEDGSLGEEVSLLKFYGYKKCSGCREAEKTLTRKKIAYEFIDVTETPPSAGELNAWFKASQLDIKKLLNTSGEVYRSMGLKDKIGSMSEAEIIQLLAQNGRLIKRPLITDGKRLLTLAELES
jgi:arsenate reductase